MSWASSWPTPGGARSRAVGRHRLLSASRRVTRVRPTVRPVGRARRVSPSNVGDPSAADRRPWTSIILGRWIRRHGCRRPAHEVEMTAAAGEWRTMGDGLLKRRRRLRTVGPQPSPRVQVAAAQQVRRRVQRHGRCRPDHELDAESVRLGDALEPFTSPRSASAPRHYDDRAPQSHRPVVAPALVHTAGRRTGAAQGRAHRDMDTRQKRQGEAWTSHCC